MDFARHHDARARLGGDPHAIPASVVAGILAHAGAFDDACDCSCDACDAWLDMAPRPYYRSVWDVYGLRRRPRRSR